jgi:glycerol-3-phosphate dehydrogenase (NAD(P)+)
LANIQESMNAVAEGVLTARSVYQIATERSIDMPIATQVYRVLFEGKSPRDATVELMQRPLKVE